MVTCDQQEKVAYSPKVLLGIFFKSMLNYTVYEWVGMKFPFYELASRN